MFSPFTFDFLKNTSIYIKYNGGDRMEKTFWLAQHNNNNVKMKKKKTPHYSNLYNGVAPYYA